MRYGRNEGTCQHQEQANSVVFAVYVRCKVQIRDDARARRQFEVSTSLDDFDRG